MRAMKRIIVFIIVGLFIGASTPLNFFTENVRADKGDVVGSFPSPGEGYSRGLTWDGQNLWNAIAGDSEKIFKITNSGITIDSFNSPGTEVMGLTWDGEYLWHSDWADDIIFKLTRSGRVVDSFSCLGDWPSGLAWDGQYLWNADYENGIIYMFDTSGNLVYSFLSPGFNPWGFTWDGEYLWITDPDNNMIHKLTESGNLVDSLPSPGDAPTGLAWDGQYLWNTDAAEEMIYKIDVGSSTESGITIDDVSGDFGLSASIMNNDKNIAENVNWSIDVEINGLGLLLSGGYAEGIIDELAAGEYETIQTSDLTGIGPIAITVQANEKEKHPTGFLLGPLVLGMKEG